MKHIKHNIIIIVLLFASGFSFANTVLQKAAEKAYSEKNYKAAILNYETILKEGLVSYKLHYNLGNAYYKNNEIGKAIYNYELANKLKPNNKDIKANLKIANTKTIDKIESRENFFIGAIKSGLVNALTTYGWAWLSIYTLLIALSFMFLYLISRNIILKRLGFFLGLAFIIVFITTMVLGNTALNDKQLTKFAIITVREARVHEEPNKETKTKFTLHDGTKVNVLESNTDWTNIKLENGNEGWLKTSEVGLF